MSDDNEQLYRKAAGGDAAAFDVLLQRYLPQLHAYVHAPQRRPACARVQHGRRAVGLPRRAGAPRAVEFRRGAPAPGCSRPRSTRSATALFHHAAGRDVGREGAGSAAIDAVLAATAGFAESRCGRRRAVAHRARGAAELSEEHREVITFGAHRRFAARGHRRGHGTRRRDAAAAAPRVGAVRARRQAPRSSGDWSQSLTGGAALRRRAAVRRPLVGAHVPASS